MPKDVRIIPAQGSIDFSLSQGFITSLIQLTDSGTLSIASTGPIQIGASNTVAIQIVSNNFVGINTAIPSQNLHVQGNFRLTGGLYDSTNSPGTANQLLISTGAGIAWTSVNVTGILTASGGIANRVSKFLDEDTLGNSNITDSGTQIVLGSASSVSGILTSFGYFGPGTNITNLNASNLASGTIPSAVVSGSYSGITSVGTLTQLITSGFATASGFFGPGTFVTNLNASNLASGTVPSAVVSGTYSGITSVGTLTQLITTGFATASGFFGPGTFVTNLNASNLASGTVPSVVVTGSYSGITSVGSLSQLIVTGFSTINNIRISGSLYDGSFSPGLANQILISTGSGIAWTTSTATGILTGSGTINTVPKFNTANSLTNSNITDNGIAVTINSRLNVVGIGSFTNDLIVNQITVGQGGGQNVTNTAIGFQAGIANTSGTDNTATGNLSLNNNLSGSNNTAYGSGALRYFTTASNNVAIGLNAMRGNTSLGLSTGGNNVAVGASALAANTSGNTNVVIGQSAANANTTGSFNVVVGAFAFVANTTGNSNIAVGTQALQSNTTGGSNVSIGGLQANTTGSQNVSVGHSNLNTNTTGNNNTSVGNLALRYTSASNLVAVGYQALQGSATTELNTGTQNTALGYQAGVANTSGSRNTFIGYQVGLTNTSGADNTSVGNESLKANTTGSFNNAFGVTALRDNTSGQFNNSFGYQALLVNTTGGGNSVFGHTVMQANTTGSDNTAMGVAALISNITGSQNVAIGRQSLRYYDQSGHTAIGFAALQGNATVALNTGIQNVAVGYQAGTANTSGNNNTFVGYQAGLANTSGSNNSAFGFRTLYSNLLGDNNTAVGYQVLLNNITGSWNTAVGHNSLFANTSGSNNTATGHGTLTSNTTGSQNAAFGLNALASNTTANSNTGVGFAALRYVTTSSSNTAVGSNSLQGNVTTALNTGTNNTAIGASAGAGNTSGSNNVFIGLNAGVANTSGNNNIYIGRAAGATMTTGSNNTIIGEQSDGSQGSDYQIAVGRAVIPTGSNLGAWGGVTNSTRTDLGVGTFTPLGRIHIETLASGNMGLYIAGAASQTGDLVEVNATTNGQNYFTITGIGSVGIYTSTPSQALDVNGGTRLRGRLFDGNNAAGTAGQLLSSTGSGIAWTSVVAAGILTGSGTINTVPKFNTANSLTNSNITDSGTQIVLGSASSVSGILTSFGYFGPGTNITNLNASNLASGTVPSAVVSGAYSGITSVGTLAQLITSGFATASGFFGPGTFVTNLNASSLASGTVPSAVVSGSYSGITSVGTLTQLITSGFATASGFFGPGTFVTNLNASNLASGTVPSAVVSGSYSGITSVGTLTQLITSGFATASGFFGPGTNITNLNASNLASGTVPSAVVSGAYSGITSVGSLSQLIVTGFSTINNIRISGSLYDSTFSPGTANQLLISTGSGIAWTSVNVTGILTASGGIANRVTKFLDEDTLGNSNITDTGTQITLGSAVSISGIVSSFGYFGPGTNITNLNASNLASGTVPSAVVSGAYSGITSVGTLTQLITSGFATASGFFGPGTFVTNLNASNLASGTVPSAVVSGSYSGITSVGTLTQLITSGFATASGFFGPGTFLTNLNASSLASGTVPSAVVSGSYSGITSVGTLGFLNVTGVTTAGGFSGPGTNLTNLNASNLASGIVSSARISGAYSGITSVGTLTGLNVSPGNIVLSPTLVSSTTSSPARYLYKGVSNTLGARNENSVSLSPTFGRILNRNPDLLDQRLGYGTYDNNNSNQVNVGVASDFSAPNSSGYVLTVNYLGIGTTAPSPGLGGYFIALPKVTGPRDLPNLYGYRRGERIWHRIWASISTGYNINFGSNPYGDGGQFTWISSTIGTNNWYLYEGIQNIGTSGTFNDTAYYYLSASVSTATPVTWYVASTHLIGEDESPTVQYTSNLNIGYTTGLNQNFGDFASTGTTLLALNSASVGIRTAIPTRAVDVNADIRLRAILYDGNNSAGTAGQLLSSTATGIVWTSITASGIITGIGSVNVIPKFGSVFSLTTSNISDSGTQIVFNSNTNTTGLATFRNISLTTSSLTTSAFMQFVGAYNDPITLNVGLATTGSISFNGSQGQLFTITNNLTTGSIFSVNDVSGIPSIDVNASGTVLIAPYGGNVGIGTTNAPDAFRVQTTSRFIGLATFGAVNITRNLYDVNTSPGTAGQLLSSLVTGVAWSSPSALGVVTGSAAANQITVWNSSTSVTGFSTFVFVNPGVGINTTAPIKSLHIRNNGILIDGSSTSDPAGYSPRLIIDSGASSAFVLADFKNNLGSVFYVTGSRVSIGNSSVVTNVFNVNGGDALINTLTVGLGSGQIATNTALGVSALAANTTGNSNVAVGYLAGLTNTSGTDNTFVGSTAGRINNAGSNNTAVGSGALPSNTSGSLNAAFGATALNSNSTGAQNSAFGYGALNATTTGSNNSAFGFNALQNNVTTSGNVGMGRDALRYYANSSNQTAVGFGALRGNSTVVLNTGTGNVAVGYQAGLANTSGSNNTFIGELAGTANTSGSNNLFVGYSAGSANLTGSNNIGLGYLSLQSNTSGTFNFASGGMAANTTGSDNSAAGHFALNSNTTGSGNAAFGRDAMRYWVSASNQTAIGYGALQGNSTVALNTGNSNIAVGFQAGVANTSGSLNSYLGHQAGQANASGTHNTLVGALAGLANTASHNTVLGANSFAANTSGSANVIVGSLAAQANVSGANNVAVGYNVIVSNTSGGNNTAVGYQAMEQNTTGGSNVAIGRFALRYYQAVSNQVAIGDSALAGSSTVALNTGTQNTAIGYAAGAANTSGVRNVFIGWSAGIANTSGSDNVAVGNQALWGNQTGIQNVAIGSFALNFNILGNYNIAIGQDTLSNFENTSTQVAIGYRALRGNNTRGLNTGFSNVAVGREALGVNTSGSNNTALGAQAGIANTTGNQNTFIGAQSGDGNITGNSNTYLGYLTDGLPAGSYQIAVGDSVTPTASNLGAWGGNTNATRTNLGVGTFTPLGRLHVETLAATNIGVYIAGSASQTGNLFEIDSTTNGPAYFVTTGIGSVGIYTSVPTQPLHVQGNVRITGGILDSNNQIGLAGSVLSSTGSGISWIAASGSSAVTGSGSTNRVAKFSGPSSVSDSTITDTGSVVTIGVGLSVSGFSSSFGFYGPGTFITNLNASNLASGTVPSAVVSGSYSGITSVGTLTQLITTGFATASGFFGPGTFISNLNASNLASGTVPSAVVSGTYSGITSVGTLSQLIVTGISTLQNLELDGWLRDVNNSIGSSGQLLSSTGSGVAWSSSTTLGIVTGSGSANQVTFWATSNRVAGISTFVYNGNLGIGTTNPTNLLHVSGTSRIDTALIINSNNIDTFTQRGFAGASTSTASTSFITLATITIPTGYTLNIEAKINGWSSTSLNESGKVFGIFYNDSGTAVQVGTTDVVSKYIGVGGNFDIQTSGSNANIVVKSNSGISSWNWSTQYDYLLSRNVSSGGTPPVPPVPPSPTPP